VDKPNKNHLILWHLHQHHHRKVLFHQNQEEVRKIHSVLVVKDRESKIATKAVQVQKDQTDQVDEQTDVSKTISTISLFFCKKHLF